MHKVIQIATEHNRAFLLEQLRIADKVVPCEDHQQAPDPFRPGINQALLATGVCVCYVRPPTDCRHGGTAKFSKILTHNLYADKMRMAGHSCHTSSGSTNSMVPLFRERTCPELLIVNLIIIKY